MQLFNFGMKTGLINGRLHSSQLSWTVNSAVKPISYHIVSVFVLFPVFQFTKKHYQFVTATCLGCSVIINSTL